MISIARMSPSSRIARYGLAATAALSATSASADMVYSGVLNTSIGSGFSLNLDFDLSGSTDLRLKNYVFFGGPYQGASSPNFDSATVGFQAGFAYSFNLASGTTIGPSSNSFFATTSLAYGANNPNAQFNNANPGLIGFRFTQSDASTAYGWLRVRINNAAGTFTLVDWAYDNAGNPVQAGVVPEPSTLATLGLLASGAAGLGIYRRRKQAM